MQTRPEQFSHLKFLFGLSSQTSQTVEAVIQIKKIVSRVMAISPNESNEDERELFLTPTGEKRLLKELTAEIVMEIFYDMDVISTNSEANIYNILKDLLITPRTIHEDQGEIWNSVLWNPEEKCRPDEAAGKWNSIWQKLKEDDQIKLLESFNYSDGIGIEMDEMFNKLYEESKDTVRWDGKKFVPKPILLSKFNFSNLKHHQSTENPKVDLRYYKGILWIGMNIAQDSDLMSNDEAFAIQKQLKGSRSFFEKSFSISILRNLWFVIFSLSFICFLRWKDGDEIIRTRIIEQDGCSFKNRKRWIFSQDPLLTR